MLIGPHEGAGLIWSATYGSDGRSVVTVGGNDAQLGVSIPCVLPLALVLTVRLLMRLFPMIENLSPPAVGIIPQSYGMPKLAKQSASLKMATLVFINAVAFSPDQNELMTASDDRTVRFWKVANGQLMTEKLLGHSGRIMDAEFSIDGKKILTASSDKTARLWDRDSTETIRVLDGHEWAVLSCALSPDGKLAVTGSADNMARVWDLESGELLQKLSGHTASVSSVAFSPDGKRIMTGGQDNLAKIWDLRTGKELLSLAGHSQEVTSVGFSRDGLNALTAGRDSKAVIWPVVDWKVNE